MAISTYTPNRCRYTRDRLKQHVYLISAASCTIHIDNGNAWVDNLTETPLFIKGAVTLNESTSYDDRFKFTKSVSLTVQNYVNLSYLQGKYYVILEDEGGNYWFVNPDFPCLVTYTYTLGDDVSETEFTFNSLSNFPLLRFTGSLTDVRECEQYVINGLKRLRLTEAKNVSYDQSTSTVYLYHGKEFYDVEFLDGTLSITEEFDGNQVNTNIQFAIQLDDYKPSWQYNLLEYQDNRYAAIITTKGADGEFISGFEFGLVPSYSIVGGDSQDDIITVTLQGASSYGSLPSGGEEEHSVAMSRWTVVEKPVEYTWRLTEEWMCLGPTYRWINLDPSTDYYCSGITKHYKQERQVSYDSGETWTDLEEYRMGDIAACCSTDCGFEVTYRWDSTQGEYECDGVYKYGAEVLQYASNADSTYHNVEPEYKRKTDTLIERLSDDCGYVESTGEFKFSGTSVVACGNHYDTNSERVLTKQEVSGKVATHSVVGDCTETIGAEAFAGSVIQQIDISSYTKEIQSSAFAGCSGLTNIVIPDTVEKIGGGLFSGSKNLTAATLPSGIDYIPGDTFNSTGIENYVVPNSIKLIGAGAFGGGNGWWDDSGNTQDLNITFTTGVTDFADGAFVGRDFNGTLSLPSSLKYIGDECFRSCIYGGELVIPEGVEHIGTDFITMDYPDTTGLGQNLSIPGSVKLIQLPYMFNYEGSEPGDNDGITGITLHEGTEAVTTQEEYGYGYNPPILNNLPNSLEFLLYEYVDDAYGSSVYREVIVPANVKIVHTNYVTGGRLRARAFLSPIPPVRYGSAGTSRYEYIFVPDNSVELYKAMWTDVASGIRPLSWLKHEWRQNDITTYECIDGNKYYTETEYVSYDNGVYWTPIPGSTRATTLYEECSFDCGCIPPGQEKFVATYNDNTTYSAVCDSTTSLTTATTRAHSTSYTNMTTAIVGSCNNSIGANAFDYCRSLTACTIGSGVTSIGNSAFYNCYGLRDFEIPNNVTSIGGSAFYGCSGLTSCTIGSGVTTIENGAFYGCTELQNIVIPDNVISIGNDLFGYCSGLTTCTIGSGVTSIGETTFYYCTSLSSCTIGNSVTNIGKQAFWQCWSLTSITIPSSVISIGNWAFGLSNLSSVTVNAVSPPVLGEGVFSETNLASIYVPAASVNTYKAASGWSDYASIIQAIP